jgi:hypothetical protein
VEATRSRLDSWTRFFDILTDASPVNPIWENRFWKDDAPSRAARCDRPIAVAEVDDHCRIAPALPLKTCWTFDRLVEVGRPADDLPHGFDRADPAQRAPTPPDAELLHTTRSARRRGCRAVFDSAPTVRSWHRRCRDAGWRPPTTALELLEVAAERLHVAAGAGRLDLEAHPDSAGHPVTPSRSRSGT